MSNACRPLAFERDRRAPPGAVPLTTIRAAAGAPRGPARSVETLAWVTLSGKGEPLKGQFIAAVDGHSMEPRVPNGSLCLFRPPSAPPFGARIFLVAHAALDDDLDGPFALKRIEVKSQRGKRWVTLRSLNPNYPPITLDARAGEPRIIAELIEVLVKPAPT